MLPLRLHRQRSGKDTSFTTASVLANDNHPESSTLSVQSIDTTGTFTYDPNGQFEYLAAGEQATDTFTYTLNDGSGDAATAIVTITTTGVLEGEYIIYLPLVIEG